MLVEFFFMLRQGDVPVSITEYLTFLGALEARLAGMSCDNFYYLSRACLVKDERNYDRFDRIFGAHFKAPFLSAGHPATCDSANLERCAHATG